MMKKISFSKAQSISEYAVLLAVIAGALLGMQVYLKRGIQGRVRDLADQISTRHYESKQTVSTYTTQQSGTTAQQYQYGASKAYQGVLEDGTPDDPANPAKPGSTPEKVKREGFEVVYPEVEEH